MTVKYLIKTHNSQVRENTHHDMSLNGLHHIGQKSLALRNEPIFPHFISDQTDQIGGEENFFYRRRVGETGRWDL